MEREISYAEALDKVGENGLLQIDPDKVPRSLLPVIAENRRQLKPLRDQWQNAELKEVLSEYTPEDGAQPPTPPWMNGEAENFGEEDIEEWFDEQGIDPDEYTGVELQLGRELTDPRAAMAEINRRMNETQTVNIATAPIEEIFEIEGVDEDDWESIDRWSFMISANE